MKKKQIKIIVYVLLVLILGGGATVYLMYDRVFNPNIKTPAGEPYILYIPSGSVYEDVLDSLYSNHLVQNRESFEWTAGKKNYAFNVKSGRYLIRDNMSNNELINRLRSGSQEPVQLVINMARTPGELAGKVALQIEPDSSEIIGLLQNDEFIGKYEFDRYSIMGLFIPNTYELWWNASAADFIDRMYSEYQKFWSGERTGKAKAIGLDPNDVITMASIIIQETNKEDEYRRIAGLYMNRIEQGIKLQADPTVIYGLGDFTRQRVLTVDTQFDSPYNTYLYYGLPPGPISIPSITAIDAVLNYEEHDYIFFCAKDDFSGYHVFATTLAQHNRNARLYQNALNRRRIMR